MSEKVGKLLNGYLKAVTMAQVAGGIGVESKLQLVTWMDVADPSDAGGSLSASLRNLK